ncbi:MAG: tetratricopeptide repeat protein [Pseudomonadota bacterium]
MYKRFLYYLAVLILAGSALPCKGIAGEWSPYYDMGVYAFENKQFYEAEAHFLEALTGSPDNAYCLYYLGRVYLETQQYGKAEISLDAAWEKRPDIPGLALDRARLNFLQENYVQAYEQFKAISGQEKAPPLAVYYTGMCLYRQEKFDQALGYFLDAAEKNKSLKASSLYYAGMCQARSGQPDAAMESFRYVSRNAGPVDLRESAGSRLAELEKQKQATKPLHLELKLGMGHDDNVRLDPIDRDLYADEGDSFVSAWVSGSYAFYNRNGYRIGAGLSHYQIRYADLDDYTLAGTAVELFGIRTLSDVALRLGVSPVWYRFGGDDFLSSLRLGAQAAYRINSRWTAQIGLDTSHDDFDEIDDRDGNTVEGSASIRYALPDDRVKLLAGLGYKDTSASDNLFSSVTAKASLECSVRTILDMTVDASLKMENQDYDKSDPYYHVTREDTWMSWELALSRHVGYSWLGLEARIRHDRNSSNIDDFDYKRTITGLYLTVTL